MIDLATVTRMAELARLDLTDAERALMVTQLAAILDYVNQLEGVDTTVAELAIGTDADRESSQGSPIGPPRSLILRADIPTPSLPRDLALANAPVVEAGQIWVPSILPDDA